MARALQLPAGSVEVKMDHIGGGFGSKFPVDRWGVEATKLSKQLGGAPIKLMPVLRFEGRDDIGVSDGAEQAPAFTNANRHRDRQGPELLGETHRLASTTLLLLATAGLQGLDTLELRGVRLDDERLAEQVVAGVPRRDLANVARPPEVLDILEEDDLHGWAECTNRRGRPPRGPSSTR